MDRQRAICTIVAITLGFLAGTESAGAPKTFSRPSENIAIGAPCMVQPAPDYKHCTDTDDLKQLTDGVYSEGHFWTQPATVGWQNAAPILITVDLGAVKPIRGLSFNTAAGAAGVNWPTAIQVLVADEENAFRDIGDLAILGAKNGSPPPQDYAVHRYWTDALKTHGRYVVLVLAAQPYAFVDEIEVYAGEPDWVNLPIKGPVIPDIRAHLAAFAVRDAAYRCLRSDITELRERADDSALPLETRIVLRAELDALLQSMDEPASAYGDDFRAVLPLNPVHARVFAVHAKIWRGKGRAPVTVWQSPLWDHLSHLAEPPQDSRAAVAVALMLNEYRAGAFNLSNASPDELALEVRVMNLPGGQNPPYVAVHEVAWTDTQSGQPVAAALPEASRQDDAYLIHIPSGMTRQVWLTFHPADIEPGDYAGQIQLKGSYGTLEVPVKLAVSPIRFPDRPTLHCGGWDYVDSGGRYGVTPRNREAFIAHLRAHFVDSPWATSGVMPHGAYDADGAMTAPPDTTPFDEWLQLWPDAGRYCVFASVGNRCGTWTPDAPQFATAVKAWASFWAQHARGKGVDPSRLFVLLVDEPREPEHDATILAWARAIRDANTGLQIWEDPIYLDIAKADPEMLAACHALCPNRPMFLAANQAFRDVFVQRREAGAALEFYSCSGPARLLDPYSYYRLQPWTCWQYNAPASYFWAFGDNGGVSSWNEYRLPRSAYSPLFLDETSVTGAKEMEAIREGIEDYEYLVMLRDAILQAQQTGAQSPAIAQAQTLLDTAPQRVLEPAAKAKNYRWREEIDRTVADQVRIEILHALVALRGAP